MEHFTSQLDLLLSLEIRFRKSNIRFEMRLRALVMEIILYKQPD